MDLESRDLGLEPGEGLLHQGSEVDRLAFTQTPFAAGQGEQGIDQMRLFVVRGKHLFCGGAPFGVARVRIVERNLEEIALGGEGGAQFMGGVGDEVLLGIKGTFESREEAVEGVAELLELVLRAGEGQTFVEAGRGDPPGGAGDGSDGSQHSAGDKPSGKEGEHGDDPERDGRVHQQLVRVGGALCGLDRACLGQLVHRLRQVIGGLRQLMLVLLQARIQVATGPEESSG